MTPAKRTVALIFCLVSAAASAAPPARNATDQSPETTHATIPAERSPEATGRQVVTHGQGDTIMRRLRVIIDDLKKEGAPPVGCMEG